MAKHGDLITDGGVTWKVIDTRVHGYIAETPNFYSRSGMFVVNNSPTTTSITTPDKLLVNINGHGYMATATTININATSSWDSGDTGYATQSTRVGMDFYIYACEQEGDVPKWIISSNSTCPTGYTDSNSRKIGGFHCLCLSVGSIQDNSVSGLTTGAILPLSIWDLRHRPQSEPEGMVWVKGIGKWVDIYLASWSTEESKLVSKYRGTTADGGSTIKFHGEKFVEEFGKVKKHLPMRDEFIVFAKGSNELTNITGSKDKVYAGGWTDSAGRRMISSYGIEDCCGFLWQWTSDVCIYSGSSFSNSSVYSSSVDSQQYGQSYGSLCRALVGGRWSDSSACGSRCVDFGCVSSNVTANCGARAASEPRKFE